MVWAPVPCGVKASGELFERDVLIVVGAPGGGVCSCGLRYTN